MSMMNPSEVMAKPEVKRAIESAARVLRDALPEGTFAGREVTLLALANEICREVLVSDLLTIAGSFPDEILVNGIPYRRHELGMGTYHSLCGELQVARFT